MMITTYDLFGNKHLFRQCNIDDMDRHYYIVEDCIAGTDETLFKDRMEDCIDAGTAFVLEDDSCFLYYLNSHPEVAEGCVLYGKGAPIKMLALFSGVFLEVDTKTFKIDFHLHAGKMAAEYLSLVTMTSLKRRVTPGYPLVVRVDHIKKKVLALLDKRGVEWVT